MSLTPQARLEASRVKSWGPANLSHTFPLGLSLYLERPTEFWGMTEKGALSSEALLCAPPLLGLSQRHQDIWPFNEGGQLTQPFKIQMHMGITAEWAALALNSIPSLLKSHVTSQLLLALLLLPPRLQGSFCPRLEETALSNITCNMLVYKAAACSLNTPGAFPALSFWSDLPLPLEHVPHHSFFRSYPCLQTYPTCHLFQAASRHDLFSFDDSQYFSCLSYDTLSFCLFTAVGLILSHLLPTQAAFYFLEQCLALINISLTLN